MDLGTVFGRFSRQAKIRMGHAITIVKKTPCARLNPTAITAFLMGGSLALAAHPCMVSSLLWIVCLRAETHRLSPRRGIHHGANIRSQCDLFVDDVGGRIGGDRSIPSIGFSCWTRVWRADFTAAPANMCGVIV